MSCNMLVTGGGGYLGSVLVPLLLEQGHRVTVLDTFQHGCTLMEACRYDNFIPVKGDIRDEKLMKKLVAQQDVIIPLAALVGAPLCAKDPSSAVNINQDAIAMMLSHLSASQRVIYPSTNSGYGIGQKNVPCTESSPLHPISLYGVTKAAAEKAVLQFGGVAFRLATVFGMSPRMRTDLLVNDFAFRAFCDGTLTVFEGHFKRNFIHIRDVAAAFVHALDNYSVMQGQCYNVGLSDANLSKLELCARIQHHIPSFIYQESPVGTDPDMRDYIVSNAKIEATGFKAQWSLDRGIAELIRGYAMLGVLTR